MSPYRRRFPWADVFVLVAGALIIALPLGLVLGAWFGVL